MRFSFRQAFLGKRYHPLNTIYISSKNLTANYRYLKSLNRKIKIAPVLKSNAYGHGLEKVGQILDPMGAPFVCVDSLYEAYQLFKAGIKTPVLIMGYIDPQNLQVKKLPFKFVIWDLKLLDVINRYQKGASVHIFVDTGMNREGVAISHLDWFVGQLDKFPNVKVEGVMSHLAQGEDPKSPLTKLQIENFKQALKVFRSHKISPEWVHLANSAGFLTMHGQLGQFSNAARAGRGLYGVDPTENKHPKLKPALKFTTKLAQVKRVKQGERVGYNGAYKATKDMLIGILPAGYYDGVDRRLADQGVVLIGGQACQIVGKVSMNITTIDLEKVEKPFVGQEAVVYSDNPSDPNCLKKAAEICQTVPYELLVHEASSTRREVVS